MEELFSDPSTLSNIDYFKTIHIDWYLDADFTTETLDCRTIQKFECIMENEAGVLLLDTRDLSIDSVQVDGKEVTFDVLEEVGSMGQPLEINLKPDACILGAIFNITIKYKTSSKASTTQWLPPNQTLGRQHPYIFTHCEAIHARSLIPCQDSPKSKFSFFAEITIPEVMIALMSAIKGEENVLQGGRKVCRFEQKDLIPPSMLVFAISSIEPRSVAPHSKVWCEPDMIDACEFEFGKSEDPFSDAESIMDPYTYDMLVLPSILSR